MQQVMLFENQDFGQLRMVFINGKQYFMAGDVAKALGYSKPNNAVSQHCKATLKWGIPISGKVQEVNFIPEGDVYRLIVRSKLPKAEEFEKWVFDEVLPSIRQNGGYINGANIEQIIKQTVAETVQAVVPEVMKAVITGMVPLLMEQQKAVRAVQESQQLENKKDYYTYGNDISFHMAGINKITLFPEEMQEQVNKIMEGMRSEQKLNCSLIAKYCKKLGYPVSNETVKEYFEMNFLRG